jgi:hypothetical protein
MGSVAAENEESPPDCRVDPCRVSRAGRVAGVPGVVVAVVGVQVTAKAVGDVRRWPVAELLAGQGGWVCRCAGNSRSHSNRS